MVRRLFIIILAAMALLGSAQTSQAALTAVDPGPYSAATGFFPLWYSDGTTTLDLCLSKAESSRVPGAPGAPSYMCTLLPLAGVFDDTLPIVFPFNWPDESFWFTGDASIVDTAAEIDLTYVSALEAAFGGGLPAAGDQISFARIRIRVDVPVAGTYTVTHPYGVEVFDVATPGVNAINMTRDIGIGAPGVFTGALAGDVGPFLQSVNGPYTETNPDTGLLDTFVGDPNLLEPVTGSPFGTNFVRIEGPGGIALQTNDFAVSGRIWNGNVPTALNVGRSTYARNGAETVIDVFATSTPTATVTFRETVAAGTEFAMTPDGAGNFYGQDPLPAPLPPFVVVTATDGTVTTPTPLASSVVDVVKISRALYLKSTLTLIVEAASSDAVAVPTLTALGFAPLSPGLLPTDPQRLQISPVAEPPATVTVKSSAGGSDTEPVIVTDNTPPVVTAPAPISVLAPLCATSVPASDPEIVAFLAAATATDLEDGDVTASIITDAPTDFPLGDTIVTFTATDSTGLQGTATSTVTVTETPNTAPVVTAPAPITITVPAGTTSLPATDPAIAAFLAAATASDAEDGPLAVSNDAPANFLLGITTVTFTATDACGLSASATSSVTIQAPNNNPPVVTAPGPISVDAPLCAISVPAGNPAIAAFLAAATAADAEDGDVTASITTNAPADFPLGDTIVTFTATDSGGAQGTATSTVTVTETPNTAPVVTAPAPITITVPAGTTSVPVTDPAIAAFLAAATATDAEDGPLTVSNDAPANFLLGITTVTFTATDACGLSASATSSVTIQGAVDLNIAQFRATNTVRVSRQQSVTITLRVRNVGTVDLPVPAMVTGVQNGVGVYNQTLLVNDPVGGGATSFTFPAFTPTAAVDITWTVTVQDANPDTAVTTTSVRP